MPFANLDFLNKSESIKNLFKQFPFAQQFLFEQFFNPETNFIADL